jgi:hypothetical protein
MKVCSGLNLPLVDGLMKGRSRRDLVAAACLGEGPFAVHLQTSIIMRLKPAVC